MKALISVYDKTGVLELAKELVNQGYEILSSGGTYTYLKNAGIEAIEISEVTGFKEILGGRVKTLHPAIHGGILFREDVEKDLEEIKENSIEPIDIVVVNLYPFEKKMKELKDIDALIEFIDIGGPTLIRAAAKNHKRVSVLTDIEDYGWFVEKLKMNAISQKDKKYLALKAFWLTSYYDSIIANYFSKVFGFSEKDFKHHTVPMLLKDELRYGENPHQKAYIYENPFEEDGVARVNVLQGKKMSYNNYLDTDSVMKLISEFSYPCCAIVKHNNPSGVAIDQNLLEAYKKAFQTDPEAAFGGIVAFNRKVDEELANLLTEHFYEIVIAPEFSEGALKVFSKKKNLRIVKSKNYNQEIDIRSISGGYLSQDVDSKLYESIEVVSLRRPTEQEFEDAIFAWKVSKWTKSNAIVIVKNNQTIGIGAGQVSRVDSLRGAIRKAKNFGHDLKGSVVASDAFFPFRDSIDIASEEGISGAIQPGGSIRDKEVVEAANEHNMFMIFTHMRHFRH
ncbi:bifunctional phosphoribosylaminoimidazolecarboxamide formyltransferase/IMP cyclohydrolase [Hydrogenobaculum acidophilum]